jgi:hypothetical protein
MCMVRPVNADPPCARISTPGTPRICHMATASLRTGTSHSRASLTEACDVFRQHCSPESLTGSVVGLA